MRIRRVLRELDWKRGMFDGKGSNSESNLEDVLLNLTFRNWILRGIWGASARTPYTGTPCPRPWIPHPLARQIKLAHALPPASVFVFLKIASRIPLGRARSNKSLEAVHEMSSFTALSLSLSRCTWPLKNENSGDPVQIPRNPKTTRKIQRSSTSFRIQVGSLIHTQSLLDLWIFRILFFPSEHVRNMWSNQNPRDPKTTRKIHISNTSWSEDRPVL